MVPDCASYCSGFSQYREKPRGNTKCSLMFSVEAKECFMVHGPRLGATTEIMKEI